MKIGNLFNRKRNNEDIVCSVCGEIHKEMPDIGSFAPYHWNDTFNNDPKSLLTEDLCIIEERDYFIRGVIQIPILKSEEYFGWGVWVSQKKENFEVYREKFNDDSIGPFFGWLSTKIDYYNTDTLSLKTKAHFRGNGLRPIIEIGPCEHEIYLQQSNGIPLEQAWNIVHYYKKTSDNTNN